MNIINLTPHAINIYDADKNLVIVVEPSGEVARVSTQRELVATVHGVPYYRTTYGGVTGLPKPEDGTVYVVSGLLRSAVPGRIDLWQPGELLRNETGQPIGCIGLQQ